MPVQMLQDSLISPKFSEPSARLSYAKEGERRPHLSWTPSSHAWMTNLPVCKNGAVNLEWEIEYYQKENGNIPVEDFLLTLDPKLRAKAYSDIMLLKRLGINIREPYSSPIKGDKYKGLFELRTKFSSDITRIFYFLFDGNKFVLLHGFVKKTNKTPDRELKRALNYKLDYESRCKDE